MTGDGRRRTLLLLNNTLGRGGVENVVRRIYDHYSAAGHDVRIGVPAAAPCLAGDRRVIPLPTGAREAVVRLRRLMATAAGPAVVHVHHRRWALLATVAARSIAPARRPVVVEHVHNVFSDKRRTSFRGDLLVAAGTGVAQMLVDTYGRDPRRVRVLPNTAGDAASPADPRPADPRPADPRPVDAAGHVVFGVGRLVAHKRPAEWVEVVRRLRTAEVVERGVWMGDGPLLPALTAGPTDGVDFVGDVDDVERRLRRHRGVLLVTSAREALPLAILEAMANGVPVVARDVGSIRDAVVTGSSGVLLPADARPADFARAVATVCRDGTYDGLAAGARARFRAEFTAEAFFRRLDEIYEEGYERVRGRRREPARN